MNHVGINAAVHRIHVQEFIVQQRPGYIDAAFRIPVMPPGTSSADRRVTVSPRHILRESAFININRRSFSRRIRPDSAAENISCGFIRLRMLKRFFYG